MTAAIRATQWSFGPTTAGEILAPVINPGDGLGVPATMSGTYSHTSTFGGDSVSNVTAYCGYRVVLPTTNISARKYLQFQIAHSNLVRNSLDSWANGGMRLFVKDTSGNWAGYFIYGYDWSPFGTASDGYFAGFAGLELIQSLQWQIELGRTPDRSSGTLNWGAVAEIEVHFRPRSSGRMQAAVGRLQGCDDPLVTGASSTFEQVVNTVLNPPGVDWNVQFQFKGALPFQRGYAQNIYSNQIGLQIGDGSTTTSMTQNDFGIAFYVPPEDSHVGNPAYVGVGAYTLLDTPRLIDIYQAAADNIAWTDFTISTSSMWGWRARGNVAGTLTALRGTFVAFDEFAAAHGTYTDCIWADGTAPVDITADTSLTGGTIRGAVNSALRCLGAAGDYSAIKCRLDNPGADYDLEVGSGGAGTYDFSGLTVPDGYTLKVRNNSATNAVTVNLAAGITYSTSTAGGSITVSAPPITTTLAGLVAGAEVRIYDLDDTPAGSLGTELAGTESTAGTTFDFSAQAGNSVWVQVMAAGYAEFGQQFTVPAINTTFNVTLQPDLND